MSSNDAPKWIVMAATISAALAVFFQYLVEHL